MTKKKLKKGYLVVSEGSIDGYFRTIKEATDLGGDTVYEVTAVWDVNRVNKLTSKPLDDEFEEDDDEEEEDEDE